MLSLLWPTRAAAERALAFHQGTRSYDGATDDTASDEEARLAAVYTRQDVAVLVYWQGELHRQLVNISRGVWLIAFLVLAVVDAVGR